LIGKLGFKKAAVCHSTILNRSKDRIFHFSSNNAALFVFSTVDLPEHPLASWCIPVFLIQVCVNAAFIHINLSKTPVQFFFPKSPVSFSCFSYFCMAGLDTLNVWCVSSSVYPACLYSIVHSLYFLYIVGAVEKTPKESFQYSAAQQR